MFLLFGISLLLSAISALFWLNEKGWFWTYRTWSLKSISYFSENLSFYGFFFASKIDGLRGKIKGTYLMIYIDVHVSINKFVCLFQMTSIELYDTSLKMDISESFFEDYSRSRDRVNVSGNGWPLNYIMNSCYFKTLTLKSFSVDSYCIACRSWVKCNV